MKINILYTIDTGGPGGAETVFLQLLKNVDRRKYNPYVILSRKGWVYDEVLKIGLCPEIINVKGSYNFAYLLRLIRFIRTHNIYLIHAHLFGSNLYCSIAGLICRVPVISTFHGAVDCNPSRRMLKLKFSLINRGSRFVVFVSDYLRDHFMRYTSLNKNKAIRIYNGIEWERFAFAKDDGVRQELGYTDQEVVIGSIGNIRPSKGYDSLLKAAAIVIKEFPECKFIVVGEGRGRLLQDLLSLGKTLGITKNVTFVGFRSDVENVLKSFDLFLLPSSTEGLSIATIEAMAAGLPTIVTDCGGPREIVTHLKDGIIVDTNSPQAIAEAIKLCITNPELRRSLSINSRQSIRERFTLRGMIKEYETLYSQCLNECLA